MTTCQLVATFGIALTLASSAAEPPKVLPLGEKIPEFTLPGIDGKNHSLSEYANAKILTIIFTSNHCPDAVAAAPRMEELHQAYKDKGVAVIAVSPNNPIGIRPDELGYSPFGDSFEEMKPFAADFKWTFPYLYDGETQAFATACGAQSSPHVFVFDAERKLRYTGRMDDAGRAKGPVQKSYVVDAIEALLKGEPVKEPSTRSLGCSTKWIWKKDSVTAEQKQWEERPVTVADLDAEIAKKLAANPSKNVRLINFWSTTCGPCVAEFPMLVDTARRFSTRNFEFISVSLDPKADRPKVEKFLKSRFAAVPSQRAKDLAAEDRTTTNYHWVGDNVDHLGTAIDPEWTGALPFSVLIAPGGKILWKHSGELDPVELRRQILKGIDG